MNPNEHILKIVIEAFDLLDSDSVPLSKVIQRCIRIARLRNDFLNLWWLEWEMVDVSDKTSPRKILSEIAPHLAKKTYEYYSKKFLEQWLDEREFIHLSNQNAEEKVLAKSVPVIEIEKEHYAKVSDESKPPNGLHPVDLYFVNQSTSQVKTLSLNHVKNCQSILVKVHSRVHDFLSQIEKQLIFGQIHSDIFEKNRSYVDLKLGALCPDALLKFVSAHKRIKEDDPESWAQSLTTCRRLLKSLADSLYPAPVDPVAGIDGKKRKLTEDKYIARLWQYVFEKSKGSTSWKLLTSIVNDLGNRIDKIYELTNKGVHAEVSEFEVNQCVIQTYLITGDLLRLSEDSSAISSLDSSA